MSLCRTPVNQNTKRKLETDFNDAQDANETPNTSKKFSSSMNKSDSDCQKNQINKFSKIAKYLDFFKICLFKQLGTNIIESEIKSSIFKIANLEQQLLSEKNERTRLEMEFKCYKDKQNDEFQVSFIFLQNNSYFNILKNLQEIKQQLELSLKNAKTNEKLIISEMEHMRSQMDVYERDRLPEKEKEIKSLKAQIENVKK